MQVVGGRSLDTWKRLRSQVPEHSVPGLPLASLGVRVQRSFPKGVKPRMRSQCQVDSPVFTCLLCKGEGIYRMFLQGRRCKFHLPGRVSECSSPFFVHSAPQRTVGGTCRHSLGKRREEIACWPSS